MEMKWVFDKRVNCWVCGEADNGCGVYEHDGELHGNIVVGPNVQIFGPFHTLEEAQAKTLAFYLKR
jgi:L-lactate utilization protein LutB